jgi:hypothetical protein
MNLSSLSNLSYKQNKLQKTASGKVEKLKARIVAQGNMEKQRIKTTRATVQKQIQKQRQENAENNPATTKTPQPIEETWSPCASSRGVKLLISTTCASHRTLKSGDFLGAYLQAKVHGRHFVRLPLEYAYYFPEYAKYFVTPSLLNKGVYGFVYSGKYWNIEFSEWLYSKGFIQSQAEPFFCLLQQTQPMVMPSLFCRQHALRDAIEKDFEDSVRNRFDVKFLDPAKRFLQMRIHRVSTSTKTKATP